MKMWDNKFEIYIIKKIKKKKKKNLIELNKIRKSGQVKAVGKYLLGSWFTKEKVKVDLVYPTISITTKNCCNKL